jgi:Flp pilus assembly protein TadD
VIEITSKKLEASIDDTIVMSRLAEAYARFGGKEEANAILKRVFELEPNDGLALYNCACAYALIGDQSAARFALRRAFESGFRTVASWAKMDSAFDSMREDPQLNHLLAELRV